MDSERARQKAAPAALRAALVRATNDFHLGHQVVGVVAVVSGDASERVADAGIGRSDAPIGVIGAIGGSVGSVFSVD
jgi:hypothetical protein